ncbi:hypothetical protein VTL71DRAFT_8247 [Oculimacula yallundae]|uniref:Uncharacterized protein n=1 Tax=Oculimacula yallundae TaxID=86028 RepID=A0ABR4CX24_9HELO
MQATRTARTTSGKILPDPPDFNTNVFRAVEAEWLHYALGPRSEKLAARWITVTMAGGKKHVQLQKDDGRGHAKRPNAIVDHSGYYMLSALDGKPSILILTVQDMAEAVYRHWLARGTDEKTQEVFCRRFGNKYEGTRIEDITWILRKIKLRTKEAEQGLLASYTTASSSSDTSQTAGIGSAYAVRSSSKSRLTIDLSSPPTQIRLPSKSTPKTADRTAQAFQLQSQRSSISSSAKTATKSATNNTSNSSHANDHSLSASRKRLNTESRDFSERESRRLRISLAEQAPWSGKTSTQSANHTLTPLIAANSSARRIDLASDKVSTSNGYTGTARNVKTDLSSPSRSITAKGPHNVSGPATMLSSITAGKGSTSRLPGKSTSSTTVDRNVNTAGLAGSSKAIKKSESHDNVGISSLQTDRRARQDNPTIKTNDDTSHGKTIRADPRIYGGSSGASNSGKQARKVSDIFEDMSIGISSGSNTKGSGSGSAGFVAPKVHESMVRKQNVVAGNSTVSPMKVTQGPTKNGVVGQGGSPMKVNKSFGSSAAKPVSSPMTPVRPAGYPKPVNETHPGSGPPKSFQSPSTPMGPRSNLANPPSYGPSGRSTPNGYRTGFQPRFNSWKREPDMGQYEKAVDSTAHLYKSAPEPERYSEEWQNSRLGLGSASKQKENAGPAPKKENTGPTPSPAHKTPAASPNGLIGVLNVISDWSSGKTDLYLPVTMPQPQSQLQLINPDTKVLDSQMAIATSQDPATTLPLQPATHISSPQAASTHRLGHLLHLLQLQSTDPATATAPSLQSRSSPTPAPVPHSSTPRQLVLATPFPASPAPPTTQAQQAQAESAVLLPQDPLDGTAPPPQLTTETQVQVQDQDLVTILPMPVAIPTDRPTKIQSVALHQAMMLRTEVPVLVEMSTTILYALDIVLDRVQAMMLVLSILALLVEARSWMIAPLVLVRDMMISTLILDVDSDGWMESSETTFGRLRQGNARREGLLDSPIGLFDSTSVDLSIELGVDYEMRGQTCKDSTLFHYISYNASDSLKD